MGREEMRKGKNEEGKEGRDRKRRSGKKNIEGGGTRIVFVEDNGLV